MSGVCTHYRQRLEGNLLPCADPSCKDGKVNGEVPASLELSDGRRLVRLIVPRKVHKNRARVHYTWREEAVL